MVGLFHLGNKGSPARSTGSTDTVRPQTPPPPYRPDVHEHHPVFAAATTTTTTRTVTTTTHTTTHFFSLPLWRRRAHQHPNGSSPEIQPLSPDELGIQGSRSPAGPLKLDKDLPPTPPMEDVSEEAVAVSHLKTRNSASPQRGSTEKVRSSQSTMASTSRFSAITPFLPPSESSQSTAALAGAALGLGLPPVMGGVVAGPSSDVNSVSFIVHPSSPSSAHAEQPSYSPVMRRAKSLYKDEANDQPSHSELREQRRARGLSLGPLLSSAFDDKGKGKQKEVDAKPLSRKSSFWNRKRNDSQSFTPENPPSPSKFLQLESLPALQPLSPFRVDGIGNDSSPGPSGVHLPPPADLRRRHSDRAPSQSSKLPALPDDSPPPPSSQNGRPRRKSSRPQTADGASSPRTVSSFIPSPPSMANLIPLSMSQGIEPSPRIPPLRPRSQTNPPLLHRLSMNLFGSSSSAAPSPIVPYVMGEPYTRSPSTSFSSSRPSLTRQSPKVSVEIPKPRYHEEESPEIYLQRLIEAVSKAEVASVLASSGDEFHTKALKVYLSRFDFNHDPLDVALRRLLMDVGLPRETQQIDRVIEAFAARYRQCHPNLFSSEDHPYILAFSLIMLHTDAFNKSNKRKMTKADYVKNTRLPGVAPEVLDCFYDNIVFAPFIFIEDPLDVNGQRGLVPEGSGSRRVSALNGSPGGHSSSSTTLLGKSSKIDPYYLITRNLLDDLRVNIRPFVPVTSPYFYQGTGGPWEEDKLLRAFATASIVEVPSEQKYTAHPWFGLTVGAGPSVTSMVAPPMFPAAPHEVLSLKVTKVGLLLRKDDVLEGGRKAGNRKWKEWSVLLTGSQLLFHRDPLWAQSIQSRLDSNDNVVALNHASMPRPDEMYSVRDAVAVFDRSYMKHEGTLRLVMPDGRHLLLQAKSETEMNEWIACINYASAFKTAGVRMRSLGLSGEDIELTGQAAAMSHLRDLNRPHPSPRVHTYSGRSINDIPVSQHVDDPTSPTTSPIDEPLTPPMENPSKLFKATFDQVKADLASGRRSGFDTMSIRSVARPRAYSLDSIAPNPTSASVKSSDDNSAPRPSSRSQIIRRKLRDLESRITVQQAQLDSDMRFVRNVSILTPFQQSTRNRLQTAIQNIAKRIMQVRLDLEKLTCHRDVLAQDLASEEREWQRTTKIALSAATQQLEVERKRSTPRMALSIYDSGGAESSSPSVDPVMDLCTQAANNPCPHSAAASSYHSALDFGLDSARSAQRGPRPKVSFSLEFSASASLTDISASTSSPYTNSPQPSSGVRSSADSEAPGEIEQSTTSHEQYVTISEPPDEQAEEWNKTRAAKRVSLVRVPSTLKLFSPKHSRDFSQVLSEDSGVIVLPDTLYRTRSTPIDGTVTRPRSDSDAASLSCL